MKDKILLSHGSGGKASRQFINNVFKEAFSNRYLDRLDDSAVLDAGLAKYGRNSRLCFTTDSYVVDPLFFPGGDIGKLSICGTVNDLAVKGASPLYISCGFIIEEGFDVQDLLKIVRSMKKTAAKAGVLIVTGDTKVVPKGKCDKLFINTSGIGIIKGGLDFSVEKIKPGDKILINGPVGSHGLSVLSAREGFKFGKKIVSDCANLDTLIGKLISAGIRIKFMRDATRGGVAAVLNEITEGRKFSALIEEKQVCVRKEVSALCDILGFDPLYIANEGKVIVIVDPSDAVKALGVMRKHDYGAGSSIIGEIRKEFAGRVILKTAAGGSRIVDMPVGDQLPRIC